MSGDQNTVPDEPRTVPHHEWPSAIFLMGPTASGKSKVACDLVRALPCELISVDSAQVYRHMDIGTAKPDAATLRETPHHLIDIIEPDDTYSAARFREDALTLMREICERGNIPLLVGGTMLYFRTLTEGLAELPAADAAVRMVIDTMAEKSGWPALHAQLASVDPETAARLQPGDAQRIQRALEVYYITDKPMSALLTQKTAAALPFTLLPLALEPSDRAVLHDRIALRFDQMLGKRDDTGIVAEVAGLRARGDLNPNLPSMRCVGYRQAWEYLDGAIDRAQLRETGIIATRQLAKRQLTWLRSMPERIVIDCLRPDPARRMLDHLAALQA